MECYKELNLFGPNGTRSPDLIGDHPPEPEKNPGCFSNMCGRNSNNKTVSLRNILYSWLSLCNYAVNLSLI